MALFATYPLVLHFTEAIPYVLLPEENAELLPLVAGDHLQAYYWFWLFKDNLIGQSAFFSNPYEFHIGGRYLQHGYAQFPVSILFFLLSVFGNVPAHNLLILLTYVFSGLSLYYLVRIWGLSAWPSFIGGLVFALAPSRQTQLLAGHINPEQEKARGGFHARILSDPVTGAHGQWLQSGGGQTVRGKDLLAPDRSKRGGNHPGGL